MAPDADFVPGTLALLVPGNTGRLLDPRRTPIRILSIAPDTGQFTLEITAFEDTGARWVLPLEHANHLQLRPDSATHPDPAALAAAVARFDRPLVLPFTPRPLPDLGERAAQARALLGELTLDLGAERGSEPAQAALKAFMAARGVADLEHAFAERFVGNPGSGELVKGHRIVLSELGQVPYVGGIVRDPATFEGPWSRPRRVEHLLSRLAFVRALFAAAGHTHVVLWRGLSVAGPLRPHPNRGFVSASFRRDVAESLFHGGDDTRVALLMRQQVPIARLFMTHVETAAMNRQYREAEAVLLHDPENLAF